MKVQILDAGTLAKVSPAALIAYVRSEGWTKLEEYGEHADVYVRDESPELVLPRTNQIVDYVSVVSRLISILCEVNDRDELTLYRGLIGADQDVVRVRALIPHNDGSIPINKGVEMVAQSREMLLAAACATKIPQAVYRAGADLEATEYIKRVRLGQTEQGSFIVTMMAPVPQVLQPVLDQSWTDFGDEPYERQVTRRLVEALEASRNATEMANSGDGFVAFESAVSKGISANLCSAIAQLIDDSGGLEVSVHWAKTRPTPEHRRSIRFSENDAGVFKEAARMFLAREPILNTKLFGTVNKLARGEREVEGQVTFKVDIEGKTNSVSATLDEKNYSVAIHAHKERNPVIITGNLEKIKQRWRITSPTVRELV